MLYTRGEPSMRSFQQVMKGEEYSAWQQMVLASLMKEQQDTFDIEDKRQVAESAAFLASLMKRFKIGRASCRERV